MYDPRDGQVRYLVHFSDGSSGMRNRDAPLEPGDELVDGGGRYRVIRVEPAPNPRVLGHAWVETHRGLNSATTRSVRAFCEHGLRGVSILVNERPACAGLLLVGGTGLEPVTPSLSIRRIERWRLADTRESAWLSGFLSVAHVLVGVGWCAKARPC
jgi:hypothetical protein